MPKSYGEGISSIVGEQNRGWDVAKHLLTHERTMIGGGGGRVAAAAPAAAREVPRTRETKTEFSLVGSAARYPTTAVITDRRLSRGLVNSRYSRICARVEEAAPVARTISDFSFP